MASPKQKIPKVKLSQINVYFEKAHQNGSMIFKCDGNSYDFNTKFYYKQNNSYFISLFDNSSHFTDCLIELSGKQSLQFAFIQKLIDEDIKHRGFQFAVKVTPIKDCESPFVYKLDMKDLHYSAFEKWKNTITPIDYDKIVDVNYFINGAFYSFEGKVMACDGNANLLRIQTNNRVIIDLVMDLNKKPSNIQIFKALVPYVNANKLGISIIKAVKSDSHMFYTDWESIAFDVDIPLLDGITFKKSTSAQLTTPSLQPIAQQSAINLPFNQQIYLNEIEQIIQTLGEDDPRILQLSQLPSTIRLPFTPDLEAKFWQTSLKHLEEGEEPLLDAIVKLASTFDISPTLYLEMKAKLQDRFRKTYEIAFLNSIPIELK